MQGYLKGSYLRAYMKKKRKRAYMTISKYIENTFDKIEDPLLTLKK
jgi:phosphoribosylaminoimidazole-succinocarboxamide synthase